MVDIAAANRATNDAKGTPDYVPSTPEEDNATVIAAGNATAKAPPRLADAKTGEQKNESLSIAGLFEGTDLTEEFITKASTLVEAFVAERVSAERATIEERYRELSEQYVAEATAEMSANLDKYSAYVVNEWLTENKLAVESSLKLESADRVINNLKNAITEANLFSLDEADESLVQKLQAENAALSTRLNEAVAEKIEESTKTHKQAATDIVEEVGAKLTEVDKARLVKIAEELDKSDLDIFKTKLTTIAESYIPAGVKPAGKVANILSEQAPIVPLETKTVPDNMSFYVEQLSKFSNS